MERNVKTASGIERTAKDGIPVFDGTCEVLPFFREEAIQYMFIFEADKPYLVSSSSTSRSAVRRP